MGGAQNHRMGLWDAAMIKDNHVAVAGSVGEAVRRAKEAGVENIICEVDRVDQIEPALAADPRQGGHGRGLYFGGAFDAECAGGGYRAGF